MAWYDCVSCGDEVWYNYYPNHAECDACEDQSDDDSDDSDSDNYYSDSDAESDFQVECCGSYLYSTFAVNQHNHAYHHWCQPCDRFFNSARSLAQHLSSAKHQPKNSICPKCPRAFISPSAVVAHLESGTCPSRITRAIIDAYVARADVNNVITNPNRMITSGKPFDIRVPQPFPTYMVTHHAWNGTYWECCLCHNEFRTKPQLQQHLNSPRHAKRPGKMYRCPAAGCQMQIETLSGLVQHVESGKCGIRENRHVKDTMGALTAGLGQMRLTY